MSRKSITLILLMLTIIVLLPPFAVLASGHNRETSGVESVVSASDFVRGYANQLVRASARTDVDTVKQHENQPTEKGTHSVALIEDNRQQDEYTKSKMMDVLGPSSAAISASDRQLCLFSEIGLTKSWVDNPCGQLVEGMTVEDDLNWQIEIADSGIGHGTAAEVSLSLDSTGTPHVSYADWSNGYDTLLRYSHRTLSGWDAQTVPFYGSMQGVASSLALDRGNNPHIAYQNGNQDLLHMWWSEDQWNVNTIGWGPYFGSDISLALDNDDTPHVSFYSGYPDYFGLRYGYWTGSIWSIQTADGPGDTGRDSSLALDQSGYPHISYCGVDNDSVQYAVWTGSVWNTSTVTQFTSGKCEKTSLALDTTGDPSIGFAVNSGSVDYEVRYAWLTDDGWEEELVDDGGGLGVSMSLDSNNVPHLSYYDETSGALLYSSRTQNDWYRQLVDNGADQFGLDTSISVEKPGVHIAYYMPTDTDPASVQLRYAFLPLFNISGRITDTLGNPISNIEVNDGNGHTFITDTDGSYGFLGLEAGTYTITPSSTDYTFSPSQLIVNVPPDAENIDFVGSAILSINHIEVTQGIQSDISSDPVPFIAGKPTVVRAFLQSTTDTHIDVYGTLYVFDGSILVEIPADNAPAIAPVGTPDRENDRHALRFTIPIGMIDDPLSLYVEAYTRSNGPMTRYPSTGEVDLTFEPTPKLRIGYVAIDSPDAIRIGRADKYLKQLYPLSKVDYFEVPITEPYEGARIGPNVGDDIYRYLAELYNHYEVPDDWPLPNGRPDVLFGWVPDTTFSTQGVAWNDDPCVPTNNKIAFGSDTDQNQAYQIIMAHEIGHLLCLEHPFDEKVNCDRYDDDWPYDDHAIHDVGFGFGFYPRLQPLVMPYTDELMIGSHCDAVIEADKWLSTYSYEKLYEALSTFPPTTTQEPLGIPENQQNAHVVLLVSGSVFDDNTAEIGTIYQINTTEDINTSDGTTYCLQLEDNTGTALSEHCFDLSFTDPEWHTPLPKASFVKTLLDDSEATRLVLTHGAEELAERIISANPPVVTLLQPNGGGIISGLYDVTWTASDNDGDDLTYALSYSVDGGITWYHLGFNLSDTHLLVDLNTLQGSEQALFRVMATDGINTTSDTSDGFFTVPFHEPRASILNPDTDISITTNQTLTFEGSGYDLEDGILTNEALDWSSDLSGSLGTGQILTVQGLNIGTHMITFVATDSDSNYATATRVVRVSEPVSPTVTISLEEGSDIVLNYSAVDGSVGYNIYRKTSPFFPADSPYNHVAETTYTDEEAALDGENYFYQITSAYDMGAESQTSNLTGVLRFSLIPGEH